MKSDHCRNPGWLTDCTVLRCTWCSSEKELLHHCLDTPEPLLQLPRQPRTLPNQTGLKSAELLKDIIYHSLPDTSVLWGCRQLWRCKTVYFCDTAWTAASEPVRSSPPSGRNPTGADSLTQQRPARRHENSVRTEKTCTEFVKNHQRERRRYLAGSVGVQDFILDDKPQPLPLLLVALWPV